MYYIKKGKKVVATGDASEVTKDNFVVEPGGEKRVWCKLEQYEFDRVTGDKKTLVNQVMGENPRDFELFAPQWKRQGMTITMLHDPRGEMQEDDVAAKLAQLNSRLNEDEDENVEGNGGKETKSKTK